MVTNLGLFRHLWYHSLHRRVLFGKPPCVLLLYGEVHLCCAFATMMFPRKSTRIPKKLCVPSSLLSEIVGVASSLSFKLLETRLVALRSALCVGSVLNAGLQTLCCFEVGLYKKVTWLILPVVICLSQRLSHACLSTNIFVPWNCVQLIISVIIYLMVSLLLG